MLAEASIGRVAWAAPDGPSVLPVNYAWYVGNVVFRTSPDGTLAWLRRRQPVAFEVDEIDPDEREGRSVLVRGWAEAVPQSPELLDLWSSQVVTPWAGGSRTLFIRITPTSVSGRVVRAW